MNRNEKKISRKGFFEELGRNFAGFFEEAFGDELDSFQKQFPDLIRPPGRTDESDFLQRCVKCGKCIRACPFIALQPVLRANEFDRGTPTLRSGTSFCRFCEGFPCIEACPTGAISRQGNLKKIATAVCKQKTCLRTSSIECNACEQICSKTFKAINCRLAGHPPEILTEKCSGCGACLTVCPVTPEPALKLKGD